MADTVQLTYVDDPAAADVAVCNDFAGVTLDENTRRSHCDKCSETIQFHADVDAAPRRLCVRCFPSFASSRRAVSVYVTPTAKPAFDALGYDRVSTTGPPMMLALSRAEFDALNESRARRGEAPLRQIDDGGVM